MPRIRYRRSYDFELYEQSDERTSSEIENGEESDRQENASGNSWLSNATIASQLSDAKIKTTISALKAQITVLEAELLSRRFTRRNSNNDNWSKIGNARRTGNGERLYPRVDREPARRRNFATSKKVASIRATLAKLGVKDVDALLTEWSKITATGEEKE